MNAQVSRCAGFNRVWFWVEWIFGVLDKKWVFVGFIGFLLLGNMGFWKVLKFSGFK